MRVNGKLNFENLTSDPSSPAEGDLYYNSTDKELKVYNGSSWGSAGGSSEGTWGQVVHFDQAVSGNPGLSFDYFPSIIGDGRVGTSSEPLGANIIFKPYLDAGTYTIITTFTMASNQGIIQASLDGTPIGATWDNYSSGTANDIEDTTVSSLVVSTTGVKELKYQADTKHASSSGYGVRIQKIAIRRTA